VVTLIALETTVQYDFITQTGNYTYTADLYDATGTILIVSNTYISTAAVPVTGTLVGLGGGTVYKFRITVVPTSCSACPIVTCPFTEVETLPVACTPPEDVTAVIIWEPEL
jgi:hypothetical protein